MMKAKVALLKTSPETVVDDYGRLMRMADYQEYLPRDKEILLKLNLSWTKYFPSCSSQPWQLEGTIKTLLEDGYKREAILPVENKTVVTNPVKGARNNLWSPILEREGLDFIPLPQVEWGVHRFKEKLLKLDFIFPEGIEIPKMFMGKSILHLPTVKTHGHSTTTGAIKNAFGGLLKQVRHYAHKYIHEVLVDLVIMQKELHPGHFAVMDGTVCGDGAGPRTMIPKVKNVILAGGDPVAVDAIAAKMMGFEPMAIPYIRMCHERGLGTGDPAGIEIVGEDADAFDFGFKTKRSFVIWGDQMLRIGFLRFLEKLLLKSPLVVWAPAASNLYHDWLWYPTVGRRRISRFMKTEWGALWKTYKQK
jgi:uncharacterized protein (DUF362 family)